jgi:hypothetical protein
MLRPEWTFTIPRLALSLIFENIFSEVKLMLIAMLPLRVNVNDAKRHGKCRNEKAFGRVYQGCSKCCRIAQKSCKKHSPNDDVQANVQEEEHQARIV